MDLESKQFFTAFQSDKPSFDMKHFDEVNLLDEIQLIRSRRGVPALIVGGIGLIASSIAIYEFVRALITSEDSGRTPLHKAAQAGDLILVRSLIRIENNNPNVQDDYGNTPLHYAAANGQLNIIGFLTKEIRAGFVKNQNGELPLHFAALSGILPVVKYLVEEAHSSVYDQTNDGRTALHLAAIQNQLPVSKYLTPRYNVASLEDKYRNTPLLLAAYAGSLNVVKYFLNEQPVDFNLRSSIGRTPLMFAAYGGRIDVMRFLIEQKGADVNLKELSNGYTPLHYAALAGYLDVIKYLIEQKHANINLTTKGGKTPRQIAQIAGHFDAAGYLQSRGGRRRRNVENPIITINDQFTSKSSISGINFDSVKGVSQFIHATDKPSIEAKPFQPTTSVQNIDVNSSLLFFDMIIRNCTGQKYISTEDHSLSEEEAQGYALCIVDEFKRVMEQAALQSGISIHRLRVDFKSAQKDISSKVGNLAKVSKILKTYVEKACPGGEAGCPGKLNPEKFNKFLATVNYMLDDLLSQPITQSITK